MNNCDLFLLQVFVYFIFTAIKPPKRNKEETKEMKTKRDSSFSNSSHSQCISF